MSTELVSCTPAYRTTGRSGLFTELLVLGVVCALIVQDEPSVNTLIQL